MQTYREPSVAIGGIGGSGTRLGAALLQVLGYYIGGDLNGPLDNLWFTLLFKRRSILTVTQEEFRGLTTAFAMKMSSGCSPGGQYMKILEGVSCENRMEHDKEWLTTRLRSFVVEDKQRNSVESWGWKEPNTHIIIDRLLHTWPNMKYIHFVRHPIDMACSANQNQLVNWGSLFLDRDVKIVPRDSLSYWCAAHRRITKIFCSFPGRTAFFDYDGLSRNSFECIAAVVQFLGVTLSGFDLENFVKQVEQIKLNTYPKRTIMLSEFNADDVRYICDIGYELNFH